MTNQLIKYQQQEYQNAELGDTIAFELADCESLEEVTAKVNNRQVTVWRDAPFSLAEFTRRFYGAEYGALFKSMRRSDKFAFTAVMSTFAITVFFFVSWWLLIPWALASLAVAHNVSLNRRLSTFVKAQPFLDSDSGSDKIGKFYVLNYRNQWDKGSPTTGLFYCLCKNNKVYPYALRHRVFAETEPDTQSRYFLELVEQAQSYNAMLEDIRLESEVGETARQNLELLAAQSNRSF